MPRTELVFTAKDVEDALRVYVTNLGYEVAEVTIEIDLGDPGDPRDTGPTASARVTCKANTSQR